MSEQYLVRPDLARTILNETIRQRTPVALTYQGSRGWAMLKSRLVGLEADGEYVLLELPGASEAESPLPQAGQSVGVSFRRGHRKCVFTSMVVDATETRLNGHRLPVLRVLWPEEVSEMQRRLYHRTPVPKGRLVPVDLWLAEGGSDRPAEPMPQRGRMLDLSAGGLSVEVPREVRPRWREDDQISCRFATDADRQPIEVPARITHYARTSEGHVQLGLQFLGLDACEQGRHVLQQIQHMTTRLQRFRHDRD